MTRAFSRMFGTNPLEICVYSYLEADGNEHCECSQAKGRPNNSPKLRIVLRFTHALKSCGFADFPAHVVFEFVNAAIYHGGLLRFGSLL